MEAKFDNLKIFYKVGLPKRGWSRDKILNLKFTNQVVATLTNPDLAARIKPEIRDTLQAALITNNNKESIHH
jgi:hypothetical protein